MRLQDHAPYGAFLPERSQAPDPGAAHRAFAAGRGGRWPVRCRGAANG